MRFTVLVVAVALACASSVSAYPSPSSATATSYVGCNDQTGGLNLMIGTVTNCNSKASANTPPTIVNPNTYPNTYPNIYPTPNYYPTNNPIANQYPGNGYPYVPNQSGYPIQPSYPTYPGYIPSTKQTASSATTCDQQNGLVNVIALSTTNCSANSKVGVPSPWTSSAVAGYQPQPPPQPVYYAKHENEGQTEKQA